MPGIVMGHGWRFIIDERRTQLANHDIARDLRWKALPQILVDLQNFFVICHNGLLSQRCAGVIRTFARLTPNYQPVVPANAATAPNGHRPWSNTSQATLYENLQCSFV